MAHIRSRKHGTTFAPRFLPTAGQTATAAAMLVLAMPMGASAQPSATAPASGAGTTTLPEVRVKGKEETNIKADTSASPKFTEPLLNTPQTITVIKKELLQQQGATTLTEALRNTPGITFTMGENGNTTTGDSVFMRGFDTQGSIFVDGIRDLGTISRDVYNLEQVEVIKGPAGADIGRGSPTGYINLSTKVPTLDNLSAGSLTLGSGSKKRVTADFNRAVPALGEGTAVRLNLLVEDSGKVDRDHIENKSIGFAPSIALGLNTPTRTYLYYQHIEQNNLPDGGIPAIGRANYFNTALSNAGINPAPVRSSNFYGSLSDFDDTKADMFTARVEHTLAPGVTLRNVARFGRTQQVYNLTGINAVTLPAATLNDPATWTVSRSRQGKDQENQILTNQTSLTGEFATGAVKHAVVTGLEFIHEKQTNYTLAIPTGTTQAVANLYNPSVNDVFQPLSRTGASTSGTTTTAAAYLFDTLKFNEQFQLNGGLRWEKYKTEYTSLPATGATTAATRLEKADDLLTYKLGALYKPAPNGSFYLAYANSQKPPGSDNFSLSATATNINSPNLDPAKSTSIELGTKWDLLDNRLALTAALYRTQVKNDVVDTDGNGNPIQMGKKTVQGLEFGAAGMLTKAWQVSAGLALMDTEVNATTTASTANQQGNPLAFSPKVAFTSWTTYTFPFGLTLGGGLRYAKSTVRNSNTITPTSTNITRIPSYVVMDAMAAYEVNKNVTLQFNLYNLADKFYIQSLNNGGSRFVLGAPRSATVTANVQF